MNSPPTVLIVSTNPLLRDQCAGVAFDHGLASYGLDDFAKLAGACSGVEVGCVVFDLDLAGIEELEASPRLAANGATLPAIALAERGDAPAVKATVKAGGVAVLEKPIVPPELLEQVHEALLASRSARLAADTRSEVLRRLQRLAPEERVLLDGILTAQSNKALAKEHGCSVRTIEARRAKVMTTLAAATIDDVVRLMAIVKPYLCDGAPL
ncbi:MAG TPA: response regulator [Pirellulales bacterium]|nr:response regulator [Pirellulales bacterium]